MSDETQITDQITGQITGGVRDLIAVHVTTSSEDGAEKIARAVLNARLAACVHISEITSQYRWQGKIEEDTEFLLVMKTMGGAFDPLARLVMEHHTYDVPEIIALPVVAATKGYAEWVRKCVSVQ
ncbi:divalent-cation tolerance protein CutA [Aquisalinus flavus]|uniref:Divalent-cation tolerance protein CutA n=1 Tax=Aquisalinus flavus TaxID=1526572 RepID=A0A8J2V3K5_9PROT|nr:divalent-cation tolerance protein CutA [Aquisalinus flavus]MBD0425692.1 divalent-cation tolerance protein CutA [Aquisalinus flavus]UNE48696.1 divalent-cation tolerance protein CutA [Aquisalinus flavus]GGD14038.1 hypothetical protein GCM10011342_23490 [Aquisalinus flavus]